LPPTAPGIEIEGNPELERYHISYYYGHKTEEFADYDV
jgi:hypothetical protein